MEEEGEGEEEEEGGGEEKEKGGRLGGQKGRLRACKIMVGKRGRLRKKVRNNCPQLRAYVRTYLRIIVPLEASHSR